MQSTAYIALGSNQANPLSQLRQAINTLSNHPTITVLRCSKLYQTKAMIISNSGQPIGIDPKQPDHLNAVIAITTSLSPDELLAQLKSIEKQQGRVLSKKRNQPRTLDLDLLLYDSLCLKTDSLTIPHPGLSQRNFVLYPLFDIVPQLILPNGEEIEKLKTNSSPENISELTLSLLLPEYSD